MCAPLRGHCFGDSRKRPASFFPSVRAGWHLPNPLIPAFYDVGRAKRRQPFEPKAGRFLLAVPKLPGLYYLVWLPDFSWNYRNRIFQSNVRDWSGKQAAYKLQRFSLLFLFQVKPSRTRHGQMCAGRVRYHQVPTLPNYVENVALVMLPRLFRRQQVARRSVVTKCRKSISYRSWIFASNQNFHNQNIVCVTPLSRPCGVNLAQRESTSYAGTESAATSESCDASIFPNLAKHFLQVVFLSFPNSTTYLPTFS